MSGTFGILFWCYVIRNDSPMFALATYSRLVYFAFEIGQMNILYANVYIKHILHKTSLYKEDKLAISEHLAH